MIRTCLGPRAMLKMLMDPMGGIVMTNDGNAILREVSWVALASVMTDWKSTHTITTVDVDQL